ncbi:MAG: hypothetical protein ABEN55_08005, partial [Bradymonadaceae bacterium]
MKFFRGDAEESEPVQGSYLSHLLDEIEPHLAEELEECPTHDPLPLLVALTLRKTSGDRFEQTLECPVADAESPSLEPPPPPGAPDEETGGAPPPAPESPPEDDEEGDDADLESEHESEADVDADHEGAPESEGENDHDQGSEEGSDDESDRDQVSEEDSEDESDPDDQRQSDSESDDDAESEGEDDSASEDDEESGSEDDEEIAHAESTEEDETDEYEEDQPEGLVDDQQSPEPSSTSEDLDTEVYDMEASVETEADRVPETGMLDDEEVVDEKAVRVDSEIVLEMGRVFLGMLVENDCLPVELQMAPEEIDRARKLLAGYFLGDDGLERRARQMLRLVEEKFDDGMFSQARILLQLFDADESTRIENDRNLFYEEMILRFGIQRRHPVGSGIHEQLEQRVETVDEGANDLDELFDWLAETIYVSFDVYGRDSEEVAHWRELAEKSERPGA